MKYSLAIQGHILDSYAFQGISKIAKKSTIRDRDPGSYKKVICPLKPNIYSVDPIV